MVQCLGRAKSGANPWLATSVCGKITDPQLSDILQKIKFWRSFFRFHQWDLGSFCNHVHRTGFDACAFDAEAFHKSLVRFDSRDRGAIVALAIGKHVTRNHLCKFARTIKDEFCPLCGAIDSKHHRVFECPHLADLRGQHATLFQQLESRCASFWSYGILATKWDGWRLKLGIVEDWPAFHSPAATGTQDLFTDGSEYTQECAQFTLASAAVVQIVDGRGVVGKARLLPGADHISC